MTILYLMRNRINISDEEYQEFKLKIFHRIQHIIAPDDPSKQAHINLKINEHDKKTILAIQTKNYRIEFYSGNVPGTDTYFFTENWNLQFGNIEDIGITLTDNCRILPKPNITIFTNLNPENENYLDFIASIVAKLKFYNCKIQMEESEAPEPYLLKNHTIVTTLMNITVKSSIMPLSLKGHHIMTFENSETAKNPFAHTVFQKLAISLCDKTTEQFMKTMENIYQDVVKEIDAKNKQPNTEPTTELQADPVEQTEKTE